MGNDPPQFSIFTHRRSSCAATCQITRDEGAIIDICMVWWFLVRLLFFHCMPTSRHSDSTPDSRRACLCSRLSCGSYGAGSPAAVVCSRELASCGNGGTLLGCSPAGVVHGPEASPKRVRAPAEDCGVDRTRALN